MPSSEDVAINEALATAYAEADHWKRKFETAEQELVKLRRLDAEYGRVETAIIMADPDFDGDSDHANCGNRLIASVNRLAERADNAALDAEIYRDREKYRHPSTAARFLASGDPTDMTPEALAAAMAYLRHQIEALRAGQSVEVDGDEAPSDTSAFDYDSWSLDDDDDDDQDARQAVEGGADAAPEFDFAAQSAATDGGLSAEVVRTLRTPGPATGFAEKADDNG